MELVDGPRPGDVKGRTFLTCGMHVHVAVADRHEGIAVLDRVRPWLAVLSALASNSPYWQGRDTGYASYRSIVLGRLPTVGPSPVWGSISVYDRVIREVINTGAAFDAGMVYYDARLSPRHPTIEIRVPDVVPTWLTRSCWLPWPEVWSTSPSVSGTAGCDHSTFRSRRCARRLGGPAATGSRKTCTTRWRTGSRRRGGWSNAYASMPGRRWRPTAMRPWSSVRSAASARGTGAEQQRAWATTGGPDAALIKLAAPRTASPHSERGARRVCPSLSS